MLELLNSIPLLLKAGLVVISLGVGIVGKLVFKLPKDSTLEQAAEKSIKDNTGIDIDFSSLESLDDDDIEIKK